MKICCISDTHGKHNQLDLSQYPADVLVHAGDWTQGRDSNFSESMEFLNWFASQDYKYKILVAGNHEKTVELDNRYFYNILESYPTINYLQDSAIVIEGLKFYGSPRSNKFCNWAFMGDELSLDKYWQKIHNDTNVLITHGPAYRCNDHVKRSYWRDPHVGSQSLHYRKKELEGTLKLHISGHIHEAYGISGASPINVCASVLNEHYELVNPPVIVQVK